MLFLGMSPASAIRLNESKLLMAGNKYEALAASTLNPTANTVYHWHNTWRKINFGTLCNPILKIKEKICNGFYKEQGKDCCKNCL